MEHENYYKILGINENSTQEEIKKAYRRLSLYFHPDRNKNDREKTLNFKKINDAYEILKDIDKKKHYDDSLKNNYFNSKEISNTSNYSEIYNSTKFDNIASLTGLASLAAFGGINPFAGIGGFGQIPNISNINNINNIDNIENEIINSLFTNLNNIDNILNINKIPIIKEKIIITLEQAYNGSNTSIIINKWKIENKNKINIKESINIDIISGIYDGEIILLKNKGNYISDNLIGDVEITINIKKHKLFFRNDLDLFYNKNIKFKDAFCGFTFDLPFLNGKEYKINNKKGNIIYPGFQKEIINFGMIRDNKKGNLYIKFNISFPKEISDDQINFITNNF